MLTENKCTRKENMRFIHHYHNIYINTIIPFCSVYLSAIITIK